MTPLTHWWEGSNFKNQWNDSRGIYSDAPSRLIEFKHRFRSTTLGYIRKKVVFSSDQDLNYPMTPPDPPGSGANFKIQWDDLKGIYSDGLSHLIAFQHHRFGSTTLALLVNKWYFPQIRPLNDPLTPRWEGSDFKVQWNDFEGIYSDALYRLIAFKHQLRFTTLWYIREKLIFSSN